jgi:acyl-coenzyme A synthetase/AMP-(fatty) acid ligase
MHFTMGGLRRQAREHAEKSSIRWRRRDYPYALIESMIDDRARVIGLKGVSSEGTVAVEAIRGLDAVIDMGALWTLGCTVMPFPAGSEDRLIKNMVRQAQAKWILRPGGDPHSAGTPSGFAATEERPTLILPTSGSTGEPKLVPLTTRAVEAFTKWAEGMFTLSRRTVLGFAPINFDLSILEIWATLATGGTVDLVSDEEALNPRELRRHLSSSRVDLIQAVPFVFQTLKSPKGEMEVSIPGVRDVIVTGSKASHDTRRLMVSSFPNAVFHNVYGSTETNNSFMFTADKSQIGQFETPPIGFPLPGVEAHVLDHDGNVLAGQATGELHVRTPFMMSGYLGAARSESKLFPTGDIVFRDQNGRYHIESRSSRIVKVRGNRINLDQLEAVIEGHPGVEESVVIARPDSDQELRIEALVKLCPGSQSTILALRGHCSKHLPAYAMPGVLRIVNKSFPRTSTHKIDRNASELIHYKGTVNA